jgi:hypothetical protein
MEAWSVFRRLEQVGVGVKVSVYIFVNLNHIVGLDLIKFVPHSTALKVPVNQFRLEFTGEVLFKRIMLGMGLWPVASLKGKEP